MDPYIFNFAGVLLIVAIVWRRTRSTGCCIQREEPPDMAAADDVQLGPIAQGIVKKIPGAVEEAVANGRAAVELLEVPPCGNMFGRAELVNRGFLGLLGEPVAVDGPLVQIVHWMRKNGYEPEIRACRSDYKLFVRVRSTMPSSAEDVSTPQKGL